MITINFTLVIQAVLFLIFMVIMNRLLFQPVLKVLDERRERIDGGRARARELDEDTERRMAECDAQLQAARIAGSAERVEIRAKGQEEVQRIVESARADGDRIIAEMRDRLMVEQQAARTTLEREVQRLARDVAGKILGRAV